jgi:hypothetical protein
MGDAYHDVVVKTLARIGVTAAMISLAANTAAAQATSTQPPDPAESPAVTAPPRGLVEEPEALRKGFEFASRRIGRDDSGQPTRIEERGFYPEMGNMVTGAGWISVGVGYRHYLFGDRAFVDASTGLSWRAYKMAQARFEVTPDAGNRVSFGTQVRWQDLTQVKYFGEGPFSLEQNRSEYRLKSVNSVGYTVVRPLPWLELHGRVGWLSSPELLQPAGSFGEDNPSTVEVFPGDPVFQFNEQPDYLHGDLAVVVERRDEPGYPTRGGTYRAALSRYADQDLDRFSFNRYEAEAAQFIPLDRNANFVFAVRGWLVGTTTADGHDVPFYLMPSLGGSNTLRGYSDYRFHDRNLAVINTELRVALMEHIDVVGLFEAGNVAARFSDLNLDKKSVGVGVRVHTRTATFARLDLARSDEGWKVVFRMNDPLRLSSRHNKRTAQVPFAP